VRGEGAEGWMDDDLFDELGGILLAIATVA
jgi:hypothetical protein